MPVAPITPAAALGPISAGIQAAQGLVVPAGMLAGAMSWANRKARGQLRSDFAQLNSGQLGIAQGQQRQMLGNTAAALQAQQASNNAQLQQALAGGNLRGGAVADIAAAQAAAQGQALGQAQQQIDALSQQQAQQRNAEIRARLQAKADQNMLYAIKAAESIQNAPPQFQSPAADLQSITDSLKMKQMAAGAAAG